MSTSWDMPLNFNHLPACEVDNWRSLNGACCLLALCKSQPLEKGKEPSSHYNSGSSPAWILCQLPQYPNAMSLRTSLGLLLEFLFPPFNWWNNCNVMSCGNWQPVFLIRVRHISFAFFYSNALKSGLLTSALLRTRMDMTTIGRHYLVWPSPELF